MPVSLHSSGSEIAQNHTHEHTSTITATTPISCRKPPSQVPVFSPSPMQMRSQEPSGQPAVALAAHGVGERGGNLSDAPEVRQAPTQSAPPRGQSLHKGINGQTPNGIPPSSAVHRQSSPTRSSGPVNTPPSASVTVSQASSPASNAAGIKKAPKPQKKALAPEELSSMIQSKIVQLETESTLEEEEEKAIAKAVKKASKDISQLMENQTSTEKLELIQTKYMDLFQENKRLERDHGKLKRKLEQSNKEKDSSKAEYTKLHAQKQKIEALCRELQKENKRVKEESKRLAVSEQQKREELSSKFESTIWEIKSKMEEDSDEKKRRAEDSEMLKDKFKSFLEQYELREKHYNSMVKSREIEIQLLEAKLEQQRRATEEETIKGTALKAQVASFVKTETDLRKQLSIYVEKFKQVEETLNKSNELFITFRKEMEQMTKKTRKLEKENTAAKLKCEKMNKNILEMAEERTKNHKALENALAGKAKMENLCRALQTERNTLRKRLSQYESRSPSPSVGSRNSVSGDDERGSGDTGSANGREVGEGDTGSSSNDEFLEVESTEGEEDFTDEEGHGPNGVDVVQSTPETA
ncbi:uncharacterized protein SPPG_00272 [Spizellomyces punctatus DAOM BR117]|uniref:Alpha-taxilin n=1 Tax=Spizellomyces punctatus (strain DAOM BR117) TaxID=645134 RepID=A0A0L0HTX8_SPIPD|nr:uncharacterized protein SPPG_00272 [Spizellomyces punctatus DAOM BR117]KND04547.1 hypothetical protein SPPG_00272 [Spizellomyces punctatus DAOM BR117]|eukprot:XP_016612586.1 hypothetical protein SPPG_00272 [Spizellomyces punctatus DAOM BR117]